MKKYLFVSLVFLFTSNVFANCHEKIKTFDQANQIAEKYQMDENDIRSIQMDRLTDTVFVCDGEMTSDQHFKYVSSTTYKACPLWNVKNWDNKMLYSHYLCLLKSERKILNY